MEEAANRRLRKLDPALKSWLDNVIIPALVREYLAEMRSRIDLWGPVVQR